MKILADSVDPARVDDADRLAGLVADDQGSKISERLQRFLPPQTPLRRQIAEHVPDDHPLTVAEVMWIFGINGNHLFQLLALGDLEPDLAKWSHHADPDADTRPTTEGIRFFRDLKQTPLLTGRALREGLPRVEQRFADWYGLDDYLWRY